MNDAMQATRSRLGNVSVSGTGLGDTGSLSFFIYSDDQNLIVISTILSTSMYLPSIHPHVLTSPGAIVTFVVLHEGKRAYKKAHISKNPSD